MGVVEDIMDGIEDILQSVIDKGLQYLLEVLISGFTLVFSAPTIALATLFNDEPGFVDPLLLPPLEVQYCHMDLYDIKDFRLEPEYAPLSLTPNMSFLTVGYGEFDLREDDRGLTAAPKELTLLA